MDQIQKLWQEHLAAAFPDAGHVVEVEDADLVMLGADTAGCVQTFLENGRRLDFGRVGILRFCYRELAVARGMPQGEARDYFSRLEKLAGLVLQAVVYKSEK